MNGIKFAGLALGTVAALAACGGGGGDGVGSGDAVGTTGQLTLRVMDAPVDGATAVNITIESVELKRSGSDTVKRIRLDGNGQTINLMDYTGMQTLPLFTEKVTAGEYQWARFELANNATICFGPSNCSNLTIPNGQEIKTARAFSVPSSGVVEYVVDWDLRKSIVMSGSNYQLKPVLHLRRYSTGGVVSAGYIEGSINGTFLNSCANPGVYLFPIDGTIDDIHAGDDIITTALIPNNGEDAAGHFFFGSLEPGQYKLALTCDANLDDVTQNDSTVTFHATVLTVTVPTGGGAGFTAVYPFEVLPLSW
jgi:hypothetical protein